jgi:heme-degrading monooxygenase HmoA
MHGLFFDVRPRPGHMPHYFEHVDRLKPILARHRGLLFLERFRPLDDAEALLSHQLWQDEDALAAWRQDATHCASQSAGRKIHFEGYRIRVGAQALHLPGDGPPPHGACRFLVAAYGTAPAGEGRAYESVTRPGRFVTLTDAPTGEAAQDLAARLRDDGQEEVRGFRIARDYTMHDRAEAPARG